MSSDRVTLEVSERGAEQVGSRRVRRLRKEGLVPGVLYGKGSTRAIVVGERELRAALTGASGLHAIVDVVVEGQTTPHHAVLKRIGEHHLLTHILGRRETPPGVQRHLHVTGFDRAGEGHGILEHECGADRGQADAVAS